MSSWRQHIVLQNLYVLFSINVAITEVQVTFAKGTDTTPYHDRPWLLDLLLVTVWMILFFFGPEHTASIPPKKYLKYWFIWPQYTFPLCDGPSQMPPSPEKSTALLDTVKGIVHFEIKIWYLSAYPKGIQDVGVFFSLVDPILMFLGQTVLVCQSYNGRYRSLSL